MSFNFSYGYVFILTCIYNGIEANLCVKNHCFVSNTVIIELKDFPLHQVITLSVNTFVCLVSQDGMEVSIGV